MLGVLSGCKKDSRDMKPEVTETEGTVQKVTEQKVTELLGTDKNMIPLSLIWIGHPVEEPDARTQYDESKVHYI